jgi:hypothetical protein
VFASDPTSAYVYNGNDVSIELPRMLSAAPFQVVADVAHDRLFVLSGGGLVAEVDRVGHRPHITYHTVSLNGQPFEPARAGDGRIALWDQDGLGTIDTRSWTTHPIASGVTDAVATQYGLAAWTNDPGKRIDRLQARRQHADTRADRQSYSQRSCRGRLPLH